MLTRDQLDQFTRDGYLILRGLISPHEVELLRAAADPIVAEGRSGAGARHLTKVGADGVERYWRSEDLWLRHPIFGAVTANPRLLAVIGQMVGAPFIFWSDSLVVKPAGDPSTIAWHQDPTGSGDRCALPTSTPVFTCDIYLDRSDRDNGCVHLLPGRHLVGPVAMRDDERLFRHPETVLAEVEPGDVVLHSVNAPHGSPGNPSDRTRRTFYVSAFDPVGYEREVGPLPWSQLPGKLRSVAAQKHRLGSWLETRRLYGLPTETGMLDLDHPDGIAVRGLPTLATGTFPARAAAIPERNRQELRQPCAPVFDYDAAMTRHDQWWDGKHRGAGLMLQYPADEQVSFADLAQPWMTPMMTDDYGLWRQEAVWARAFAAWWHGGGDAILDQALAVQERYLDASAYADLGFPYARPDLGPVSLAGIVAGDCEHTGNSMWYDRHPGWELERIRTACATALDGAYFTAVTSSSQRFFDRLAGQALLTVPDLGEPMDVLAALRGGSELTLDLVDRPEEVEETLAAIDGLRWRVWDDLSARAAKANAGRGWTETMRFAASRPVWCSACDTAALFSPAMFRRFVLPTVQAEARRFRLAWHLDGPAMQRHLDALFTIPELRVVQWVPGAGKPGGCDPAWDGLYRRIHTAGRRIGICIGDSQGLEELFSRHPAEAFYIWAFPGSRAEADRFQAIAARHRPAQASPPGTGRRRR